MSMHSESSAAAQAFRAWFGEGHDDNQRSETAFAAGWDAAAGRVALLEAEVERLRAALAWYADEANYNDDHAPGCKSFMFDWTFDRGERARKSLAAE
jgi:hypothetical protein